MNIFDQNVSNTICKFVRLISESYQSLVVATSDEIKQALNVDARQQMPVLYIKATWHQKAWTDMLNDVYKAPTVLSTLPA